MADANGHIPPEELLETTWEGDRMYALSSSFSCTVPAYARVAPL